MLTEYFLYGSDTGTPYGAIHRLQTVAMCNNILTLKQLDNFVFKMYFYFQTMFAIIVIFLTDPVQ